MYPPRRGPSDGDRLGELVVNCERSDDHIEVRARGEIDLATVHHLEEHLEQAADAIGEGSRIVIDLSRCTFIDLKGIRVLAETCIEDAEDGPAFVLGPLSPPVSRLIEITGLTDVLARE